MSLIAAPSSNAQEVAANVEGASGQALEEIVITAGLTRRSRFETLQGTSVLDGGKLEQELATTIGDTIDGLPGVSQTAFGQGASRPVIRGLGGDRLRVLVNGISTFDVSPTSPDHAVAVDMSTAERVEVIRGPATLIYGSNAIAGVVNVIDNRVPRDLPEDGKVDGFVRGLYGSNSNEVLGGGDVNVNIAGGVMAHVDGFWRDSQDFEVPGFLRSKALRAADPLPPGEEEPFETAKNSDQRNWGATGGLSHIASWGFIGAAVGAWNKNYGIPVALEHEEGEEEEGPHGVRIDIEQRRIDLTGNFERDFLIVDTTRLRFGYGDYDQVELEGDEIGTTFKNQEWEGRLDFGQRQIGLWAGTTGIHLRGRDFSAIGAEAFVPPNKTFQWGLYSYQHLNLNGWRIEAGMRFDRQDVTAKDIEAPGVPESALARSFTGVSASAGVSYEFPIGFHVGFSGFRTERAPNAEELFSGGPHLATFTFELGDAALGEETIAGLEATIKWQRGPLSMALNGFYYDYDDFIFERFTGEEEDGLPVAQFTAVDARFHGFELEAEYEMWRKGNRSLQVDFILDAVEAKERINKEPLPRIPPLSGTLAGEYRSRRFDLRIEGEIVADQRDVADLETRTEGYVNVTATLSLYPFASRERMIIIQGRNLANDTIRYHTSFLKDLLPAPGRTIRIALRAGF